MRTPGIEELVRVWELGASQAPWYQGLLMLVPAFPEYTVQQLSGVTLGSRNAHLFALRRALFGSKLSAGTKCERCGEPIEFEFAVEDVCAVDEALASPPVLARPCQIVVDGEISVLRPMCSADLSALSRSTPPQIAAERLSQKAIGAVRDEGREKRIDALQEIDEYVETWLQLACTECGHEWSVVLDIVSFLWSEVAAFVQRTLDDVATIARMYGWSESEILRMAPSRREFYLSKSDAVAV